MGGFTIVELLIVIVVIGILAAITTVSFSLVRIKSENTKTLAAAQAWYKAFKMYEADHGEMPHVGFDSCLGDPYVWDYEGTSSGTNQCRYVNFSYYTVKPAIATALRPYIGPGVQPTPSMQVIGTSTNWSRGITYVTPAVGGTLQLLVTLAGVSTCPTLAGQATLNASTSYGNGITCSYGLGTRLR